MILPKPSIIIQLTTQQYPTKYPSVTAFRHCLVRPAQSNPSPQPLQAANAAAGFIHCCLFFIVFMVSRWSAFAYFFFLQKKSKSRGRRPTLINYSPYFSFKLTEPTGRYTIIVHYTAFLQRSYCQMPKLRVYLLRTYFDKLSMTLRFPWCTSQNAYMISSLYFIFSKIPYST